MSEAIDFQESLTDRSVGNSSHKRSVFLRKGFVLAIFGCLGVLSIISISIGISNITRRHSSEDKEVVDPSAILTNGLQFFRGHSERSHALENVLQKQVPASIIHNYEMNNEKNAEKDHERVDGVCETDGCSKTASTLIQAMNTAIDPCDDFYEYACGSWYTDNPVTNVSKGTFYTVDDTVQEQLLFVMTATSQVSDPLPVRDIRINFDTCMDTDTTDTLGLTPLWNQLNVPGQGGWPIAMDNWDDNKFTIYESLVHIQKIGVNPLITIGLASDFLNTTYNIIYVAEGDLGLDSMYLRQPAVYEDELNFYKEYIINSAKLLRDSIGSSATDEQISLDAQEIVDFEVELASAYHYTPTNIYDIIEKGDILELQKITDDHIGNQFNWMTFFHVLFQETDVIISENEPLYITAQSYYSLLSLLLYTIDERILANYVGWRWTMETGIATTYEMNMLAETFQMQVYQTSSQMSRESRCVTQTQFNLGMPTSRAYIDAFFNTTSRTTIFDLVENLRSAFDILLDDNTWMVAEDTVVAKEKLAAIFDRVAYPDWIMDDGEITIAYNGLKIKQGEQFNNLMRMADFYNFWNLETFRDEPKIGWAMPPTVVNAYYDVLTNSITILAAISQHPFFTSGSLAAANYGGIGMVIGHEMTHGFDDMGRRFDKDGNFVSWWTQESIDGFTERAQCFVDQYSSYSPPELDPTVMVNGQQTLGENIADNGGIREAFLAYQTYVAQNGEEQSLPGLEEYSSDQIFFLSFANLWCEHRTDDALTSQINSDPHSPGRFRVIGSLSNDVDFRNTFNCPVTSVMNRGTDSCLLW